MAPRVQKSKTKKTNTIAVIGTHLPRHCGIATFTSDLCDALAGAKESVGEVLVVAVNDIAEGYRYPDRVRFVIQETVRQDYRLASDFLNINEVDVVVLQHEYGIFGGPSGAHILIMLRELRMPVLTTVHTVLREPDETERRIMLELAELSARLVVMSRKGADILHKVYGVPKKRISFIPHGIPDIPFVDPTFNKDKFGLDGRKVILTFGLLSPGKGIDYMLEAMPKIVKRHPDTTYVVLGKTHPNVVRAHGEEYRQKLSTMVKQLGLREHVSFQNRFVSTEELCEYISAADIYVTPYLNEAQVVSGTLAYAMGAGKAIVSTPYWYAREMLADGRGRIVPFADADALGKQIAELFDNLQERNSMRKRAYGYCRKMVWSATAKQYIELAQKVLAERRRHPHALNAFRRQTEETVELDLLAPDLRHLRNMTDDTGMLQHAIYGTPNRQHGYTTDDNARALIATLLCWQLHHDDTVLPLTQTYLAFLNDAFNRDRQRFRNFMGYERNWLEDVGSEDSHARALWALGVATAKAPNESILSMSARLFSEALPTVMTFQNPRPWAFAIIGIHAYLERFRGDADARRTRTDLARRLFNLFKSNAATKWPWCEDTVTYANARLPHALLLSGRWVPNARMTRQGLRSLKWLLETQTGENGQLSVIGNQGWLTREGARARFDQQPIEVMGLVDACAEAYRITGESFWMSEAHRCMDWFLGRNDLEVSLYDFSTGGCGDGLSPHGPNANRGAESTLAWLISLTTMHDLVGSKTLQESISAD